MTMKVILKHYKKHLTLYKKLGLKPMTYKNYKDKWGLCIAWNSWIK